jgi:hypothetical protein
VPTPLCGLSLNLLDLRNNSLRSLPPQLGSMTTLRSVPLDGNPLKLIRREVWSGEACGMQGARPVKDQPAWPLVVAVAGEVIGSSVQVHAGCTN